MSDIKRIDIPKELILFPNDTNEIYFTLNKDNWADCVPSSYCIIMDIPEENVDYQVVGLVSTGDEEKDKQIMEQFGYITYNFSCDGLLTFIAPQQKPDVDINIVLKVCN